jgi:hypothetical protein
MSHSWMSPVRLNAIQPVAGTGARVAVVSVPVPKGSSAMAGIHGTDCQALPVAWYPGLDGAPGDVKQVLLMGIGKSDLPDQLRLSPILEDRMTKVQPGGYAQPEVGDSGMVKSSDQAGWTGPSWEVKTLAEKKTGVCMNEVNELVLRHDGREIGLRMGLKLDQKPGLRWWEFVTVEELWSGPVCKAIRAAGYLGVVDIDDENICDPKRYNYGPWFHKHNWVYAEIYAVLFANGLVQVTARHINNRFFDQGENLSGLVPMIGIRSDASVAETAVLDGSKSVFSLGKVQLDVSRSDDVRSVEHPGQLRAEYGVTVFHPYKGVEILLGKPEVDVKENWNCQTDEHQMWKGVARSFGFDLSFADAPIKTARYLVPEGHAGLAGSYWPEGVLSASGNFDPVVERLAKHFKYEEVSGRFYQHSGMVDGEYGHTAFRLAYQTRNPAYFRSGVHHAYAMADLGVDHTDFTIRIGGMKQNSIAMPLQRINVMVTGYLETGDPYLLRVAQSVADAAYAMDRSNWPRRSFGRDAAYIRSMTRLYLVTGESMYLRRAGDACRRAIKCQWPQGCYGDQGGTYGAHGHLSQIIKPWMGCILTHAICEYADHATSEEPAIEAAIQKYADWLLTVRVEDKDGKFWPYEIAWGKNDEPPFYRYTPDAVRQKHPAGEMQLDYMARIMLRVGAKSGDPRYTAAWYESFKRYFLVKNSSQSVYQGTRTIEDCAWHEAHLWNARWEGGRVTFKPAAGVIEEGREANIGLPTGETLRVRKTAHGVETV